MIEKLKRHLHQFKEAEPGKRFQQQYRLRQRARRSLVWKLIFVVAGVLVMILGLAMVPAPGPGWLVVFLGAGIVAQESVVVARALDRIEVRLRQLADWALGVWKRSPLVGKVAIVLAGLAITAAATFLAYRLWFGS